MTHPKIEKQLIRSILQFLLACIALIMLNYFSSSFFFRIDLTSEKKFTLKPVTKEMLSSLNDIVYIEIYLDGDLPAGFTRMQRALTEMMNEFRVYAGKNLQYSFVNPSADTDEQRRRKYYADLVDRGLNPVNTHDKNDEGTVIQKIIFPGAIMRYKEYEMPVNLLRNNKNLSPDENIHSSIETFEYEFMLGLRNLITEQVQSIAFLEGHGELDEFEAGDISRELSRFFRIDRGTITGPGCLDPYKAIIIAAPRKPFPEKDKFVIDQYIMQGGKVLWFLDPALINADSLAAGYSIALVNDINLGDQLFRYGVRINTELLKDLSCNVIPIAAGEQNSSRFTPVPWFYYPLLLPPSGHALTKGIDLVKSEFTGTLDTLKNAEIRKQVILHSSAYSSTVRLPALISLAEVGQKTDPATFNKQNLIVAVILEGTFRSAFVNRMIGEFGADPEFRFREASKPTTMFICADGDIISNHVKNSAQGPMISPLGYDRYTNQTFGNRELIMNVVHYLTGNAEISALRSRTLRLRLIDKTRAAEQAIYWKGVNTLLPLALVIISGLLFSFFRRKKYAYNNAG